MSEYTVIQVEYSDSDCIKKALKDLGYQYEEHKLQQNLFGYQGDVRVQKANIIVRRKYVGAMSNDVGFRRKANGNYELIISEYDKGVNAIATNFMQKMKQLYSKHKVLKQLKKMGKMVTSIKTDNKGCIKIRAMG